MNTQQLWEAHMTAKELGWVGDVYISTAPDGSNVNLKPDAVIIAVPETPKSNPQPASTT